MLYKTLNSTYLVKFINGPLVLLSYFELDKNFDELKYIDFIVKFKKNLKFYVKECKESVDHFYSKYANTIIFNDVLTVDNIERFKLSPGLLNNESYLKQIYDGKRFDMTKINNILMISCEFLQDKNSFVKLNKTDIQKKTPNYIWLAIMLTILLFVYLFYEYNHKKLN